MGLEIEFDSDNPGIHSVDIEGNLYTVMFDMLADSLNNEFSKSYKNSLYYKISYLIWLIKQAEGAKESYSKFDGKDSDWLDKEIEFYEYALEK